MTFEPSADANGETDLELTIREGVEKSSSTGTILSSDEIIEKEIEILSDLNQDGETGIKLTQEVYSPNTLQNTNDSSTPPPDSTSGDPSTPPPDSTSAITQLLLRIQLLAIPQLLLRFNFWRSLNSSSRFRN